MSNNLDSYCWACDYSSSSGEGNLARLFVKKTIKENAKIYVPKNIFKYKYISPFIGIIYCWYFFLSGKKSYYLNYLPLWNVLLFALLPPSTKLGPITGGAEYDEKKINVIRKFIFPVLYKISEFFLIIRNKKNYFATDLLKKNLYTRSKNNFNYIEKFFFKKIKKDKDIDFLIYYRKHKNKISNFPYKWVKTIISIGIKVHVVGDYLKVFGVQNHGYLNHSKTNLLQSRSKFSIASGENNLSIFTIECINNHNKIFINNSKCIINSKYKKNFISIDYQKFPNLKYFK